MKILILTSLYPRPSRPTTATFNRWQFRALARSHQLEIVAPVAWTDELRDRWAGKRFPRDYVNDDGLRVHHPRYIFPPKILAHQYGAFYLASVRATVESIADKFRPDVILGCFAHPDGWAAVHLARELEVPVVVKSHGSAVLVATANPRRKVRIAEALTNADRVVSVGSHLASKIVELGVDPENVEVVPNGLNVEHFQPGNRFKARMALGLPTHVPRFLYVGNLLCSKGVGVLLKACRALANQGLNFEVDVIGSGKDARILEKLKAELGLGDRVNFRGTRLPEELALWYHASDLVVLPSFSEGVPNVLREALACGRPFVASRVGGIPELADPSVTRLVEPGQFMELANAMSDLLANPPHEADVLATSNAISWEESARLLTEQLELAIDTWHARQRVHRTNRVQFALSP